jgi:malonyl CoA-acyl carrier protein transacylase/NAD(P)-dependent dehydrogenase (short-subunit alcohol dehydrogenase family)
LQPALFTIEYALARLWMDLGIIPQVIVGHSMGEYVAACLSGVFSLEDALRLIVRRAQLVAQLPPAKMLAVTLPESELLPLLPNDLSLSLINGPSLCVVAGPPDAVEEFARALTARGVMHRPVQNTHAFHSRLLDPIVPAFAEEVRKVRLSPPTIPFTSNVTGRWITAADATDPEYWARHANHTARFHDALHTLWQIENPILLEAGPGRTLSVLAQQHPAKPEDISAVAISTLRHHYENQPDAEVLLAAVGRLWLGGLEIRWDAVHSDTQRHRIPLPTYPFERSIYWLGPGNVERAHELKAGAPESAVNEIERWFYVPSWERTAPAGNGAGAVQHEGILWIVFSDRHGNDHGFGNQLTESGTVVEVVTFGKSFARHADGSRTIDPRNSEDCLRIFREIKGAGWAGIHIVHLGCTGDAGGDPETRESAQDFGFFSLMQIAQTIGELGIVTPVKIAVVSSGIHQVIGDESLNPAAATALGPCGVIRREFPNITCFNVDLAATREPADVGENHRRWIVSEFVRPIAGEILAYRGAHRWRRKFLPVTLPAVARMDRLRERGVYLITGGTGGIGLALARHLAENCRARLVLTKKNPFPEKSRWKDLLARADTPAETARTLRQLIAIESLGGEVHVMAADASDADEMRAIVTATREQFQTIHGVIHAAGIVRAGLIQTKTRALAESVMAPKVAGTWILHDLLTDAELDFLVLCSSITAVTTPFAESDYSGANAFLDAFAHFSRTQRSYPVISINWPGWKEAGQLADLKSTPGTEHWKESALEKAILTRDGIEAFRRALGSNLPQIIVSPTNLDDEMQQSEIAPFTISAGDGAVAKPTADLESSVAEIWKTAFGFEQIGVHDPFASLGGHSLLALQIVSRLRSIYRVDLTLWEFFDAPTIAGFSSVIRGKIIAVPDSRPFETPAVAATGEGFPDFPPERRRVLASAVPRAGRLGRRGRVPRVRQAVRADRSGQARLGTEGARRGDRRCAARQC